MSGTHTWDLYLKYEKCPDCDYIFESRLRPIITKGKSSQTFSCPRCQHSWTVEKANRKSFFPLFGKDEKPEFDWQ